VARRSRFVVARDGECRDCGSPRYLSAHHVIPRNEGRRRSPLEPHRALRELHGRLEVDERDAGRQLHPTGSVSPFGRSFRFEGINASSE
jgi:5-methylcytosine-specific restriction endonuclease McrA